MDAMFHIEFSAIAAVAASVLAASPLSLSDRDAAFHVSDPATHENLAIYLVRGESAGGPTPLTLQEAMEQGAVQVHETGDVNELTIENVGDQEVFIQAGDIVKGGQQDRVLSASLILPPDSGQMPIAAFCVEQGRWSQRGEEEVGMFASSDAALPSREAKLALRAPAAAAADPDDIEVSAQRNVQAFGGVYDRQGKVWESVSKIQKDLSDNLAESVVSEASPSSLQLALENETLDLEVDSYVAALEADGVADDDIIGFVVAVNGKLVSADIYPSNGLFRKMWKKNLRASATEALTHADVDAEAAPDAEAARAFIETGADGDEQTETIAGVTLKTRVSDSAYAFDVARADGGWVHRNVLAK